MPQLNEGRKPTRPTRRHRRDTRASLAPATHRERRRIALADEVRWAERSLSDAIAIARELPHLAYWRDRIPGRRARLEEARAALAAWDARCVE